MIPYPKVPRYELPFVDDGFWEGELIATEKADGSLFRVTVFDELFESWYPDSVMSLEPVHGSIVVGNSNEIQWVVQPDGSIVGPKNNAYRPCLVRLGEMDVDRVFELHKEYEGPLVWFCEAMIGHLMDYGDEVPAVLGFDVYAPATAGRSDIDIPAEYVDTNPYELRWDGFVEYETTLELFKSISVPPMHEPGETPRLKGSDIDFDEFVVPLSQYGDIQAEGVVFRKPGVNQRVKIRSDMYREVENHHHSEKSGGDEPPTQRFIAKYCTTIRILKMIMKMVDSKDDIKMEMTTDVGTKVYNDIWEEEWRTMKELTYPIDPAQIKQRVNRKSADVLRGVVNGEIDVMVQPSEIDGESDFSF